MATSSAPLAGVRVIESSMLGPAAITTHLADLGAEVIKIESPAGDYIRQMTWPIVEGDSLMHLHVNRGKRSLVLDLRTPEGVETYLALVRDADVVIEAMRPGALAKRGLSFEKMQEINPRIVFCTISGYGATGPYRDMPSHGIAYDTWAGQVPIEHDEDDFAYFPDHTGVGIHAGPVYGALGILAAVIRARSTGQGCYLEIAQSDAAAFFDWYRIESYQAHRRPIEEVYGNKADNYERRQPGTGGMRPGVRYQVYRTKDDRHVLFMASEQAFWKNFCAGIDRMDLFEKWPGSKYGDHARNNRELQGILTEIYKSKTAAEWIEFGNTHNTPIAPVNTPENIVDDPQFQHRMGFISHEILDADMLPYPLKVQGAEIPTPTKAPNSGQDTDEVLGQTLGYDAAKIKALRDAGVAF